jgi:hypothetical protein
METKKTKDILEMDVNSKVEKKNGLNYLSWAWAWDTVIREIDDKATYEVVMFDNKPYLCDENLGYMVMTRLTIGGLTREMYLPVMDSANNAQKSKKYTYKVYQYVNGKKVWNNEKKEYEQLEKEVEPATMFDINKTIQRCLVKNIAMFGLGLYIYAGEDLPEVSDETKEAKAQAKEQKAQAKEQEAQAKEQEKLEQILVLEEKLQNCKDKEELKNILVEYSGKGAEFDKVIHNYLEMKKAQAKVKEE